MARIRNRKSGTMLTTVIMCLSAFIGGVVAAPMVKPLLAKIPFIGTFFAASTEA